MRGGTLYGGGRGVGALRVAAAGAVLVPGVLDQPGVGGVADRALEGEDRLRGQDTADTGRGTVPPRGPSRRAPASALFAVDGFGASLACVEIPLKGAGRELSSLSGRRGRRGTTSARAASDGRTGNPDSGGS